MIQLRIEKNIFATKENSTSKKNVKKKKKEGKRGGSNCSQKQAVNPFPLTLK